MLSRFINPAVLGSILTAIGPQQRTWRPWAARTRCETKYALIGGGLPKDGFAVFSNDGRYVSACYRRAEIPGRPSGRAGGRPAGGGGGAEVPGGQAGLSCARWKACASAAPVKPGWPGAQHPEHPAEGRGRGSLPPGGQPRQVAQGKCCGNAGGGLPAAGQQAPQGLARPSNTSGFNTNPAGPLKALEVLVFLSRRHGGHPGFIELGKQEEQANRQLGRTLPPSPRRCCRWAPAHPAHQGRADWRPASRPNRSAASPLAEANRHGASFKEGDVRCMKTTA